MICIKFYPHKYRYSDVFDEYLKVKSARLQVTTFVSIGELIINKLTLSFFHFKHRKFMSVINHDNLNHYMCILRYIAGDCAYYGWDKFEFPLFYENKNNNGGFDWIAYLGS